MSLELTMISSIDDAIHHFHTVLCLQYCLLCDTSLRLKEFRGEHDGKSTCSLKFSGSLLLPVITFISNVKPSTYSGPSLTFSCTSTVPSE
jgi:hypothetical protein